MPSQSAKTILAVEPVGGGKVQAHLVLACGCEVRGEIAADRIVDAEDGARIAVGKYPCPKDHPVGIP